MIFHPKFATLSRYASGELAERRRGRVAEHLTRCSRCRAALSERLGLERQLREMPTPDLPADLLDRIVARRQSGERIIVPSASPAAPRRWQAVAYPIAASLLFALALALPAAPVRAWMQGMVAPLNDWSIPELPRIADLLVQPLETEPAAPTDRASAAASAGPVEDAAPEITARLTPSLQELSIELASCQPMGRLEIRQSAETFAAAAVVSGNGEEQLETLRNGFRIHNTAESQATYRVWVPRRVHRVRIELGSGPAVYTLDNALAGVWWTLHLQSDLAEGDNCIEG